MPCLHLFLTVRAVILMVLYPLTSESGMGSRITIPFPLLSVIKAETETYTAPPVTSLWSQMGST